MSEASPSGDDAVDSPTSLRSPTAERKRVVNASLTLGGAVGITALSFGLAAVSAGASVWQACALSFFTFTGASQFSAMSVVGAGGSLGAAFGGAALLSVRNFVYGVALAGRLSNDEQGRKLPLLQRLAAAQFVIDETTAMTTAESTPRLARTAFWVTALSLFVTWNLGTLIGALAGSFLDTQALGFDAAFPAAFAAMLAPHLRTRSGKLAAITGAVVVVALTPFMPVGIPILMAVVGVLFGVRR
jgi:predicted branched-subunit amino acid permease